MFRAGSFIFSKNQRFLSSSMSSVLSLQKRPLARAVPPTPMQIVLTDQEFRLCDLLNQCTEYLREHKNISTTCRIAGGWVRDKLLGHNSNDIDIALSNIMGLAFAEHLAEYANSQGVATGTITKIAQNPDQSKHLETATLKLFGLDIDLVNLRSEEYAENSRIPTGVSFGTPLEDAMRRDITINALFYNVHTRSVEDCTNQGLQDMQHGLIRTPLPATETFKDDPLRVLRCVRFASRFGFGLIPELSKAAKDDKIQHALVTKVARERVGVELDKMLKAQDPLNSIRIITDLSLFNPICTAPLPSDVLSTLSSQPGKPEVGLQTANILDFLLQPSDPRIPKPHPYYTRYLDTDPTTRSRLYLAAFLTPYLNVTYTNKKKKTLPAVEAVIRDSLKLGSQSHYLDGVPFLFTAVANIPNFLDKYTAFDSSNKRSSIGGFLRHKSIHHLSSGVHWTTACLFSLTTELRELYDLESDQLKVEEAIALIDRYNRFASVAEELDLYDVGELKPIIDGQEVSAALGKRAGPWLAAVLSQVVSWQLDHPQLGKDDAATWLMTERAEGRIQIEEPVEPAPKRPKKQ